jgi:hypothetical protein
MSGEVIVGTHTGAWRRLPAPATSWEGVFLLAASSAFSWGRAGKWR